MAANERTWTHAMMTLIALIIVVVVLLAYLGGGD